MILERLLDLIDIYLMGKVKHMLEQDLMLGDLSSPSHFDHKMKKELIKLNKQITAIKKILEECK